MPSFIIHFIYAFNLNNLVDNEKLITTIVLMLIQIRQLI